MALLPVPMTGRLLRWKADGTLENVTIHDLLDQIASGVQPNPATQRWWIDTSGIPSAQAIVPGADLTLMVAAPTVVGQRLVAVQAPAGAMALGAQAPVVGISTAQSPNVQVPANGLALSGVAPLVRVTVSVTAPAAAMALAGYAPVVMGTSTVSVLAPTAAMGMVGRAPQVTIASGSLMSFVSDWVSPVYPAYTQRIYSAGELLSDGGIAYIALQTCPANIGPITAGAMGTYFQYALPPEGAYTFQSAAQDDRARLRVSDRQIISRALLYTGQAAAANHYVECFIAGSSGTNINLGPVTGPILRGYVSGGRIRGYYVYTYAMDDGEWSWPTIGVMRNTASDGVSWPGMGPGVELSQYGFATSMTVRAEIKDVGATVVITLKGWNGSSWFSFGDWVDSSAGRITAAGAPGAYPNIGAFKCGDLP